MSSSNKRRRSRSLNESPLGKDAASALPDMLKKETMLQTSSEPERLGDLLRRKREQRDEVLDAIAEKLCIRPSFLIALENHRYEELPADAYVVGFLRTYANYLGLDGKSAIDQYRREMEGRRRKPQLSMPQPLSEGRAPSVAVLIGSLAAALLVYALWYGLSSSGRSVTTTPPPLPSASEKQETPVVSDPTPPPPPAPSPEAVPTTAVPSAVNPAPPVVSIPAKGQTYGEATSRLVLRAEKDCWILVANKKGQPVFDHILKAGDAYNVPSEKGLTLTAGNGGGLVMALDGTDLPPLAQDARTVRNLPLDVDLLKPPAAPHE